MSRLEDSVRTIEIIHTVIKNMPDDLELEKINGVVSSQMLSILCDIALSLAIIADNTMPNL